MRQVSSEGPLQWGAYTGTERGKQEFFYFEVSSETNIAVSRSDGRSGSMLCCCGEWRLKMQVLLFINALLVLVGRTDHEKRESEQTVA